MESGLPDGDLVRLAWSGDAVAFRLLVERYQPMVLARARNLGAGVHGAEDLAQEAFLHAFTGLGRLRDPQRFGAWLAGIVDNLHRAALRRADVVILLDDWPDHWHPASRDGLPDAAVENLDRAQALTRALGTLPAGQRQAVELFYYADLPVEQVAADLDGTPGAIKARLHKARSRLAGYVAAHRPDLMPYLSQGAAMVTVRLARAVPYPDEQHIHRVAVLLVDDAGHRGLALWVPGMQIRVAQALLQRPGESSGTSAPGQGLAGRLLHAAGARVATVDIGELGPELTAAQIGLDGPAGPAQVTAHLAEGLVLALEHGAPIRVAAAVMDNLAQPLPGEDPLARLLQRTRPAAAAVPGPRRRHRPRNLTFTEGLEGWELRGSFLRDATAAHWHDYSCRATGQSSAILAAAVPAPYGFADLRQAVLAEDYRGSTVRFRGQVRTGRAPGQAGLYLRVVTGQSARDGIDQRAVAPADPPPADGDWAPCEVSAHVPHDARFVLFGLTLTGPGLIELRDPQITRSPEREPTAHTA
jgi:RNA polymerase sigma factor (sigma-70 family)